jgi:hypothetical protein
MLPKDPAVIGALAGVLGVTADWLIAGDRAQAAAAGRGRGVHEPVSPAPRSDLAGGKLPPRAAAVVVAYMDRMRERECTTDQMAGAESILLAGARNRVSLVAPEDRTDEQIASDIDAAWDLVVHILRRDGVRL